MGMRLHGGELQESSRSFSFCLQNLSTASLKKKTGGDKRAPLLVVMEGVVVPLFAHVSGAVLILCFLGNAFCQWGNSVTSSKEGKLQGVNLFLHFSRETLRDWSIQGDTYLIT